MAEGAACNERARRREPKWAPAQQWLRSAAPLAVWDWLVDASSLTRRLQLACGERFHVRVLRQGWDIPRPASGGRSLSNAASGP